MAFTCLPIEKAKEFREALKKGNIKLADLVTKSSEERMALLEKYTGKETSLVNQLIEEKLVLKNKVLGLQNAMKKIGQIGRYDPIKQAELQKALSDFRARQRERILSPKEEQAFLSSLAQKILGTEVSRAEAKIAWEFQAKADAIKERSFDMSEVGNEKWSNPKDAADYGMEQAMLKAFIEDLKGNNLTLKELLKGRYDEFKQTWKENKPVAILNLLTDSLKQMRDNTVALIASVDNSFSFRQGFNVLVNSPKTWKTGFTKSWGDIASGLKGKEAEARLALDAWILSRPNNIMGRDAIGGIHGGLEEAFPTSHALPGRVPVIGRVFKASEIGFVGSAMRMRLGLLDKFLEVQRLGGADINNPITIKNSSKLALQMTARSKLGKTGATLLNHYLLWAPKMLKSAWDTLTMPFSLSAEVTPFVRQQASLNLLRLIATLGVMKAISSAVAPDSVTNDPRSTDFKNLKFGNTRFSVGIGEMSIITLASRLVPTLHNGEWGFWKVNSNGIYTKFTGKYGQGSPFDIALQFLEGKSAPFPTRVLIDYLQQSTFTGEKPTIASETASLTTPITVQNAIRLKDELSLAAVLGVISDGFGFSSNTFSSSNVDWIQTQSEELQAFQVRVGEDKFKESNDKFNTQVGEWLVTVRNDARYMALTDDEKQKVITSKKDEIKTKIFRENSFRFVSPRERRLPKF